MTALNPRRAHLATRMRAVRAAAFPSGNQFATAVGWVQSRVSKLETGTQLPTERDIREWVAAANATGDVAAELLELLAAARMEYATHRDAARRGGGLANVQAQVAALEQQATRIAEWQPAMVPGLVQTPAYARELLTLSFTISDDDEIEAVVAERLKRQNSVLYQTGRRIQLIVGEAALRSTPGTIDTLLGQLDRLVSVAGLATVELGVIPFPAMPVMPLTGFRLHDDIALIETMSGEQQLHEPEEVAVYAQAFERLHDAAATGPDAVELVQRVAAEVR